MVYGLNWVRCRFTSRVFWNSPTRARYTGSLSSPASRPLLAINSLSMRLFSEEKKSGTAELLLTSPITTTQLVLGKFVGLLYFILILVGMLMLMPLSLYLGTELDHGKLLSIALGMILLLGSFASIGLYLSSLTDNQTIAAVSTFGALLMPTRWVSLDPAHWPWLLLLGITGGASGVTSSCRRVPSRVSSTRPIAGTSTRTQKKQRSKIARSSPTTPSGVGATVISA